MFQTLMLCTHLVYPKLIEGGTSIEIPSKQGPHSHRRKCCSKASVTTLLLRRLTAATSPGGPALAKPRLATSSKPVELAGDGSWRGLWCLMARASGKWQVNERTKHPSIVGNNFEFGFTRFGILRRLFAKGFLSSYLTLCFQTTTFARTPETPHDMLYMYVVRVTLVIVSKAEPPWCFFLLCLKLKKEQQQAATLFGTSAWRRGATMDSK